MATWPESIWWAVSQILGVILVLFALRLAFREQVVVNQSGNVVDVAVAGWWFKTRSSALAVMVIGVFFFFAPPFGGKWLSPPTLRASGRIFMHDGKTVDGLPGATVGILTTHDFTTSTVADGSYSLDFPKGRDGETYQAVVVSNTNPSLFTLGVVRYNQGNREGTFDHVFQRDRK